MCVGTKHAWSTGFTKYALYRHYWFQHETKNWFVLSKEIERVFSLFVIERLRELCWFHFSSVFCKHCDPFGHISMISMHIWHFWHFWTFPTTPTREMRSNVLQKFTRKLSSSSKFNAKDDKWIEYYRLGSQHVYTHREHFLELIWSVVEFQRT